MYLPLQIHLLRFLFQFYFLVKIQCLKKIQLLKKTIQSLPMFPLYTMIFHASMLGYLLILFCNALLHFPSFLSSFLLVNSKSACKTLPPLCPVSLSFASLSNRVRHFLHWQPFNHVWLSATPWTVAHQSSLPMGILQASILEWAAISFSGGSSQSRGWTQGSFTAGRLFIIWASREASNRVITSSYALSLFLWTHLSQSIITDFPFLYLSSYPTTSPKARTLPILAHTLGT